MWQLLRGLKLSLSRLGPHYLAFSAAGVFGLFYPPPTVKNAAIIPVALYFWLGSLGLGGALCSLGRWARLRGPKLAGLVLMIVSILTYTLALLPRWPETGTNMLLLLGLAFVQMRNFRRIWKCRNAELIVSGRGRRGSSLAAYARDGSSVPRPYRRRFDRRAVARPEGAREWTSTERRLSREDNADDHTGTPRPRSSGSDAESSSGSSAPPTDRGPTQSSE